MQRFIPIMTALAIFLLGSGCGDKKEHGAAGSGAPVKVRTATARMESVAALHEAVGTVEAILASTLTAKVMGTVSDVKVEEGQIVRKNQVLVVLTQQQIAAGHQQALSALEEARRAESAARAAARAAEANDRLAQSTYERYRKLAAGESASSQELDEVKARAESAKGAFSQAESMAAAAGERVAMVRAALDSAVATREDLVLKAPYDAVVTEKMVEPGDLAAPGRPLIRLEAGKGHRVVFVLAENQIQTVAPGQKLSVVFPTLPDVRTEGTVEAVMPVSDAATRSVEVKLALPPTPGLRSGVFARVLVPGGESKMIRIPQSALVTRGQLTGIFKVDDGEARFRLVRTGRIDERDVEILSGLAEGDRFLVAPGPRMADGLRVEEGA
ncbi:MAG: efflux RND transporter periplasmic adaptor subunit [Pseudomonadota bacterium]